MTFIKKFVHHNIASSSRSRSNNSKSSLEKVYVKPKLHQLNIRISAVPPVLKYKRTPSELHRSPSLPVKDSSSTKSKFSVKRTLTNNHKRSSTTVVPKEKEKSLENDTYEEDFDEHKTNSLQKSQSLKRKTPIKGTPKLRMSITKATKCQFVNLRITAADLPDEVQGNHIISSCREQNSRLPAESKSDKLSAEINYWYTTTKDTLGIKMQK
jgi:hypothetical protein